MTEFQQIVINLVNEGKTVSEIAKQLNKNMSSVSSVVKRFNLTPKKAYENTIKDDFFDVIDTEEKAYLLGFFIADGTIDSFTNRMGISIQSSDKEVLDLIKFELNISNNIVAN